MVNNVVTRITISNLPQVFEFTGVVNITAL